MRSIGSTTITPKNFDEYKEKVFQMERRRDKALTQRKWAGIVSGIAFFVGMLSFTVFTYADRLGMEELLKLPVYQYRGLFLLLALPVYLLTILIVGAAYSGKPSIEPVGSEAEQAAALSKRCETAGQKITLEDKTEVEYCSDVVCVIIYVLAVLAGVLLEGVNSITLILALMFAALVIYAIPLAIFRVLTNLLGKILCRVRRDMTLKVQLDEYEKFCIRQEEQRKKDAAAEKERKEAERIEQLRIEGDKLYRQATAGGKADEALIEKAAQMGSRPACLYMGRKKMQEWSSGAYTREEKEDIAEEAKKYFEVARVEQATEAEKTEARFGYLTFQVLTESGKADKWKGVLAELRGIQRSGQLPKNYDDSCEWLIGVVIQLIDDAPQPTYSTSSTTYSTTSYPSYGSDLPSYPLTYADHDDLDAVQRAIDNPDRDPEASEPDADSSGSWDAW